MLLIFYDIMVEFNEIRVSPDGKSLIIDVQVKDMSYYDDIYIDTIFIDTQDSYVENGPSSKPIYTYEALDEKRVRLELSAELNVSLNDTMFFVYVVTKGAPSEDMPCCCGKYTTLGVAVNLYPIYQKMMYGIKEVECNCNTPRRFIDDMLRFKAIELSIRTGHYTQAIKYWNKFFRNIKNNNVTCRCNG